MCLERRQWYYQAYRCFWCVCYNLQKSIVIKTWSLATLIRRDVFRKSFDVQITCYHFKCWDSKYILIGCTAKIRLRLPKVATENRLQWATALLTLRIALFSYHSIMCLISFTENWSRQFGELLNRVLYLSQTCWKKHW